MIIVKINRKIAYTYIFTVYRQIREMVLTSIHSYTIFIFCLLFSHFKILYFLIYSVEFNVCSWKARIKLNSFVCSFLAAVAREMEKGCTKKSIHDAHNRLSYIYTNKKKLYDVFNISVCLFDLKDKNLFSRILCQILKSKIFKWRARCI